MTDPLKRLWTRAQRYLTEGQLPAARATLETMVARHPEHPRTLLIRSGISLAEDRMRDATQQALMASRNVPDDDAALIIDVANALIAVGEIVLARRCLDRLVLADVEADDMLLQMAVQRQTLGEHATALELLERARARGCKDSDLHFYRGMQLAFAGRLEEAEEELETRIRLEPPSGRAFVELARLFRQTPERNHLDRLSVAMQRIGLHGEERAALEFALYKELEDLQRYDEAWQALERGNAIMHARMPYAAGVEQGLLNHLIELCTQSFMHAKSASHEGPHPIFIVGLPRSGSTLLDRMLGNHSHIMSAGELPDFGRQLNWAIDHRAIPGTQTVTTLSQVEYSEIGRRYLERTQWRSDGKPFYIDKQPSNWTLAGLIHRALPEARILNMVRDPVDVCFSNYRAYFGNAYAYSYDLDALAAHHLGYRRLIAHWHKVMPERILDVPYANLVHEPKATIGKVLEFCGLEWESRCEDIAGNQAPVATLSLAQARSGIRTNTFGEWRRYAPQLFDLVSTLNDPSQS